MDDSRDPCAAETDRSLTELHAAYAQQLRDRVVQLGNRCSDLAQHAAEVRAELEASEVALAAVRAALPELYPDDDEADLPTRSRPMNYPTCPRCGATITNKGVSHSGAPGGQWECRCGYVYDNGYTRPGDPPPATWRRPLDADR